MKLTHIPTEISCYQLNELNQVKQSLCRFENTLIFFYKQLWSEVRAQVAYRDLGI